MEDNKYQEKFGFPVERTKKKVRPVMAAWIQDFIRRLNNTVRINGWVTVVDRSDLTGIKLESFRS
jgi:hypothetical protein